jgi:hypothetical protein
MYECRTEGAPAEQAAAVAVEISDDRRKKENSLPETAGVSDASGE